MITTSLFPTATKLVTHSDGISCGKGHKSGFEIRKVGNARYYTRMETKCEHVSGNTFKHTSTIVARKLKG